MAATTAAVPAVRAIGLTKVYGTTTAVDNLDLEVYPGEVFGLLGPNGAGKTTTILMMLGLTEPTSGSVEVVGLDPARNPLEVKRRVGYLPDNVGFYGTLTGRQNLRYTGRLNGLNDVQADARATELLELVGLSDAGDQKVDEYSRGMRQRLGIADALVKDPEIVVLDEPTIAIDPAGVEQMLALIISLARDRGAAVLLSSHMLSQVERVCDRVAIFVRGRVRAQGSRAELAASLAGTDLRVDVTVPPEADLNTVAVLLAEIDGVSAAEPHPTRAATVTLVCDRDVRAEAAAKLVTSGIGVVGLERHELSLDEVYARSFADEEEVVT